MLHDLLVVCQLVDRNWSAILLIAGICILVVTSSCGAASASIISSNRRLHKLSKVEE